MIVETTIICKFCGNKLDHAIAHKEAGSNGNLTTTIQVNPWCEVCTREILEDVMRSHQHRYQVQDTGINSDLPYHALSGQVE
jgi:hypothetical protein